MVGNQDDFGYYKNASSNFGANATDFGANVLYGGGSGPQKDYASRVRSTQANGAGPNSDPVNAPWSFTDYAFGRKSVLISRVGGKRRLSLLAWVAIALVGIWAWKKFKR